MHDYSPKDFFICSNQALQHSLSPQHGTKECCNSRVILFPFSVKANILHRGKERPRNNHSAEGLWGCLGTLCAEQRIATNIYRNGGGREGEES